MIRNPLQAVVNHGDITVKELVDLLDECTTREEFVDKLKRNIPLDEFEQKRTEVTEQAITLWTWWRLS